MGEALYYNFAYLGGIIYLQLYLWIIFPQIFRTFQGFFGGDSQILQSPEHEAAYRSLLTNVAPIGFIYIFGAYNKYLSLVDLTIFWRLAWVGPWLLKSTFTSTPLEKSAALVIASLDIGIPVAALLCCRSEAEGLFERLFHHFQGCPKSLSRHLLLWIGRIGFCFVSVLSFSLFLSKEQNYLQSFIISVSGCYYLLFDWFAKNEDEAVSYFIGFIELVSLANILVIWLYFEFPRPQAIEGLFAYASITTLMHIYTFAWEKLVDSKKLSYGFWGFVNCSIVAVISVVWGAFTPLFVQKAQLISSNQQRFDLLLALFVALVCKLMDEVKDKSPFHAAANAWFLPFALLWYSTEVKIMIGNNFGSPFHPSWISRGITTTLYSGNFVMDLTYSIITILITAVGTTYGAVVILLNLSPFGSAGRRIAWNGVLLIGATAYYMLAASSGIGSPTSYNIPPAIPPIIPLHGQALIGAINSHVRDHIFGMLSIAAGFVLGLADDKKEDKLVGIAVDFFIALSWTCLIVPKLFLHMSNIEIV